MSWDPLHQITQITDLRDAARTQSFACSPGGQLTQATGLYGMGYYGYDSAGNMTSKEWFGYNYTDHRITSGTVAAGYDAAGNRTSQLSGAHYFQYQYGAENRLKQVTRDGAVVGQYAYDFTGERVKKVDASGTITHYVTPAFEMTYLPDGRRLATKYVNGPAGRVAAVTTQLAAGASAMLDFRALDSASRLLDTRSAAGLAGYLALHPAQGRDDTSSKNRPLPPPQTVDESAAAVFLSAMADAVLGAAGGGDVPGRSAKDFASPRRRSTFAPSFAMGW